MSDLVHGSHYVHAALSEPTNMSSVSAISDELLSLFERGNYREVAAEFTRLVDVVPADSPNHVWRQVAHYNLAIVLGWARRFEEARQHMELSELPAGGDHDFMLYCTRLAIGQQLLERQAHAIAAGAPSIMIASLPKSASAFLSNSLARLLDVPVLRASFGNSDQGCVVESWARQIVQGGAVTHEHYPPTRDNLETLARAGVRRLFVLVRDPRAVIWSIYHHVLERSDISGRRETFEGVYADWYRSILVWLDCFLAGRDHAAGIDIQTIDYDAIRRTPAETLARIVSLAGVTITTEEIRRRLELDSTNRTKPDNFRSGDPGNWRTEVPDKIRAELWTMTPLNVRDFFAMSE